MPDTSSLAPESPVIEIPRSLLPHDGRFGSGPSKVRPEQVQRVATAPEMGTSHRQPPVLRLVSGVQAKAAELFSLPSDYRVVLGLGGASVFWDVATFGLIEAKSQHCVFGEFGSKFAAAVAAAPHLSEPDVRRAANGEVALPAANDDVDVYAWAHNETSTGACAPVARPAGARADQLVLIDGTSAAAGMAVDPTQFDTYFFSPQKGLAADGGLWFALMSPAALERAEAIKTAGRWTPPSLSLPAAITASAKGQTINTPAIATLLMVDEQLDWLLGQGGLAWSAARCRDSAEALYSWAEASPEARPFVAPEHRSPVVGTIEFADGIDAAAIARTLRANGICDVEPYRGVGGNQLRIAMFPAIDPADIAALTACLDYVIDRL